MVLNKTTLQRTVSSDAGPSKGLVIETRGLSKNYGSTAALRSLNLEVHKNSIFGFLDPMGCNDVLNIREGLPTV